MTIKNMNVALNGIDMLFVKMEESSCDFYLTGSRLFGEANESSDYDFFAANSTTVVQFLLSNGFYHQEWAEYSNEDEFIVAVYRHTEYPIDVQLVDNIELKRVAQTFLLDSVPPSTLRDKSIRRHFWNLAYKYAKDIGQKPQYNISWDGIISSSKLSAIKAYRNEYPDSSLLEAKDRVEEYMNTLNT